MRYPSFNEPVALERDACFELLTQVSTGRVGISIDALPVVLPVQFSLSDQDVLVETVRGTKLDSALRGAVVAFQADAGDPAMGTHWSVLVQGMAAEVEEAAVSRHAQSSDVSWIAEDQELRCIRIHATLVSGRLFRLGNSLPPRATSPEPLREQERG